MSFSRKFCVAPMMDWTDRHDRMFLRQFSKHTLLYTEMVTSAALAHGDAAYLLQHDVSEQPVALQLGGCDPVQLAMAAKLGDDAGYQEINLNVGCPSARVQSGAFGACLMAEPELVASCIKSMRSATSLPVTVKCRIGIDDKDSTEFLKSFIAIVANSGCDTFIIHARIAILSGLSPKENREVPPLNYQRVFDVKKSFPELEIIINGGLKDIKTISELGSKVDGVMVGREAYQNPFLLSKVDSQIFGEKAEPLTRRDYLESYIPYMESELRKGTPLQHMTRHILGLFKGEPGGKQFRRYLSENAFRKDAGISVLSDAIATLE
ncbi:MAG TPA: tRNA dihydrouridine(20/20a) synthase DusA [Gammaproteobacteria bacterium]|nr:tRNA dihydrouridine(20/20a) synthase DusA [Gammaproteobacteria bacterium]